VFCVVVGLLSRRRGDRTSLGALLIGMPGLYLAGCAAITGTSWLYVPAGILVAALYGYQFRQAHRRRDG
jgi:hypothetical protein